MLLAERLRNDEERDVVKNILEKHLKVTLDMPNFYHDQYREAIPCESKLSSILYNKACNV